tara:strand:- start:647 stop:853 length:207 start_codon:yes stop_codon:yes gene_type:complete
MKAFPQKYPIDADSPHHSMFNPVERGMELRDYFAGLAMQKITWKKGEEKEDAEDCYVIADAMMKAREK